MRNNNLTEAGRWIGQAKSDVVAAEWTAQGRFCDTACFLPQQSVEKASKGFLIFKGLREITGHSTYYPLVKCSKFDKSIARFGKDCKRLDRHYIPTRYPDGLPEGTPHKNYTEEDASEAIDMRIIDAFSQRIK